MTALYPFGECFGDTIAEVYAAARSGLRHFHGSDDQLWYYIRSQRAAKTACEFMACARGNLWRVAMAEETR